MPPPRKPRNTDLESNTAPDLIDEDRRRDLPETRPETLGERAEQDGGNPQHPVHDEDEDDMMPEDFEREIDSIDGAELDDSEETEDETAH